jgi:hypothetical protein
LRLFERVSAAIPVAWSFGLGLSSASTVTIENGFPSSVPHEAREYSPLRGKEATGHEDLWVDRYLKNTCMLDPVGGSVSFYDSKVRLIRV